MNYQNYQNLMLLSSRDTKRTLCIYSCLQIPPRENWFHYMTMQKIVAKRIETYMVIYSSQALSPFLKTFNFLIVK